MDGFRVSSVRDALLISCLSESNLFGIVSAKLGSVISRMSDKGRVLAQDVMLVELPRGSAWALPTMPTRSTPSSSEGEGRAEPLARSNER